MFIALNLFIPPELADQALAVSRQHGAGGATLFRARGCRAHHSDHVMGVSLRQPMTYLLMLVPKEKARDIAQALRESLHLDEEHGRGRLFFTPLCFVRGLHEQN